MAIPIQLKRSTAAGVSPTTLADGEVAINVAASDPKIFFKDSASTIRAFSLASYASASHTHSASQISVQGLGGGGTAFIGPSASQFLYELDDDGITEAVLESGGLIVSAINDFASEAAKYGPVTSVNSLTGTIVLTSLGVSAASAVHTHVAADITNFTSVANVVSVNAKTGVVSISHTDVTAASASHTHAASDITSGTFDAARLPLATTGAAGAVIVGAGLGVSSGTVSVTYGTTSGTACQGNDSRLSDTRTPTDGSVTTAKIANDAVTYAKLQNVSATDRLLGRSSAGAGDVEEISCGSFGRSLIGSADAAAARTTLSVQPTASPAFTGNATITASSGIPLTLNGNSTALRIEEGSGETIDIYRSASDGLLYLDANQQTFSGFVFRTTPTGGSITSAMMIGSSQRVTLYNQLLVTAGSASACGVAFSGDPDTGIAQLSAAGANTLSICTNSAERVRVDASGNVGIGAAPSFVLHVFSSATSDANKSTILLEGTVSTSQSFAGVRFKHNVYTTGWGADILAVDVPNFNAALSFRTTSGGANTSTPVERMRIASDGVITMPDVYGDTVGATNRDLFIDDTGKLGYVSSIRASKTGITAIDDVSWLRDLTPVSFHYRKRNADGTYSDEPDGTLDYGLIAEDVELVAPELCFYDVVDGEPQLRGVHYSKLITPMLRYIQQLEARIAALEERINA